MLLIVQVAGTWLVIWKEPSPSIADLVRDTACTHPWLRECNVWCLSRTKDGFAQVVQRDELRCPHLVLATPVARRRPGPARSNLLQDCLCHQRRRRPPDRILRAQAVQVAPPSGDISLSVGRGLGDLVGQDRRGRSSAIRNVSVAVLRRFPASNVGLERWSRRAQKESGVRSHGRRAARSGRRCRAPTAATVPIMPGMPRLWRSESGTARAVSVVIFDGRVGSTRAESAPPRMTPPPT